MGCYRLLWRIASATHVFHQWFLAVDLKKYFPSSHYLGEPACVLLWLRLVKVQQTPMTRRSECFALLVCFLTCGVCVWLLNIHEIPFNKSHQCASFPSQEGILFRGHSVAQAIWPRGGPVVNACRCFCLRAVLSCWRYGAGRAHIYLTSYSSQEMQVGNWAKTKPANNLYFYKSCLIVNQI